MTDSCEAEQHIGATLGSARSILEPTSTKQREEESDNNGIGECSSWVTQQNNLTLFLGTRSLRSSACPRLLIAQFDEESVTVYQAYKPSIGQQAAVTGSFNNSEFSFNRMTWVKPNFSWMMHRSGWASKHNQEVILTVKLKRDYFDQLLEQAVSTNWDDASHRSVGEWHKALRASDVLIQWDPDHHLVTGHKLPYRVLQLGIRGDALDGFRGSGIVSIIDVTADAQRIRRKLFGEKRGVRDAETPLEKRYPVSEQVQKIHRIS